MDNKPIVGPEFIVPLAHRESLRKHLEELLLLNIIRKSTSAFSTPAFTIPKKNKDIRLLLDFRKLNSKTETEHFPFPIMQNMVVDLKGAKYFSQLDLKMGYYQIKIAEPDTHKTAFSILGDKYEFLRLPFGLKNAPFFFQMNMQRLLGHLKFVKIFIDDVLIYSRDEEEHKKHVKEVLSILKEANVSVNLEKSTFLKQEVKFLGQKVSAQGIKADIGPLEKIVERNNRKQKNKL